MRNLKRNKGITLIALVITIIVLLILAAVTLNLVMGESGIFGKAQEAKRRTNATNAVEEIRLAILEAEVELQTGEDGHRKAELKDLIKKLEEDAENLYLIEISDGSEFSSLDASGDITSATQVTNETEYVKITNLTKYKVEVSVSKDFEIKCDGMTVEVEPANPPADPVLVEGLTLNKSSIADFIITNNTAITTKTIDTLTATATNESATNKAVTWSSSNPTIAEVDQDGNVTAKARGTCTITATAKDGSEETASCNVTVTERKYLYYYGEQFTSITGGWRTRVDRR